MLWQCGHLSYNDSECICKRQTWQVTQFKLLHFLFVSREEEEETFPLLALCPCNSAFPFSEGEGAADKVRLELGCRE